MVMCGDAFELDPCEHTQSPYLWVTRTVVGRPTALPLLASMASPCPPPAAWRPPGPLWPSSWRLAMFLGCSTCNSSSSRFMSYTSPSNSTDKERVCRVWTNLGLYSGNKGRDVNMSSRCTHGEQEVITWPSEHFGKRQPVRGGQHSCANSPPEFPPAGWALALAWPLRGGVTATARWRDGRRPCFPGPQALRPPSEGRSEGSRGYFP